MQIPNSSIVNCETICIPMDLTVVVASNNQRAELDLHFRLTANYIDGTYRAKSDVIVQPQTAV